MDCRPIGMVFAASLVVSMTVLPAAAQSQGTGSAPPRTAPAARPNAVERPWTTTPGSPYDRAQAVAAERVRQMSPADEFPAIDAPPGDELSSAILAVGLGSAPTADKAASRPTVAERPWTTSQASPYARAQAVAAERLQGQGTVRGASPYPDQYRSAVPAPFQYQPPVRRSWGGVLYPGMPFPLIGYPYRPVPRFRARPGR